MNRCSKQIVYEKQAEIVKAVSHPLRVAIIDYLKDGPQCVCDIAEYVKAERSNVSRHLSVMTAAGLLEYRKDGLKVIYSLKAKCIPDFFDCLKSFIKEQVKENQNLLKAM